jgi:Ca2+-binding RTX toxin-like protein
MLKKGVEVRKTILLFASLGLAVLLATRVALAMDITCPTEPDGTTCNGTDADDTLVGSDTAKDLMWGLGGDDTVYGEGKSDELHGGTGSDKLYGDWGADQLHDDYDYDGVPSVNVLRGGLGDDRLNSSGARNMQYGSYGNDTMLDGSGQGTLRGGPGRDWMGGNAGDDTLYGGSGSDLLEGSGGNGFAADMGTTDRIFAVDGTVDYIYCHEPATEIVEADAKDVIRQGSLYGAGDCETVK